MARDTVIASMDAACREHPIWFSRAGAKLYSCMAVSGIVINTARSLDCRSHISDSGCRNLRKIASGIYETALDSVKWDGRFCLCGNAN